MRKQARRLWLGDWQRSDEDSTRTEPLGAGSDQADTVVMLPADDGAGERRTKHRMKVQRGISSLAAIAVLCALGFAVSSGGDDQRPQAPPAQTPQAQPQAPQSQVPQTPQVPQGTAPPGFGGADLTGPNARKAAKAALAKYPGDIERVTAGPTGDGYVVHVIQRGGNEVHVIISDGFEVLGSDAPGGPPPGATPEGGPQGGSTRRS